MGKRGRQTLFSIAKRFFAIFVVRSWRRTDTDAKRNGIPVRCCANRTGKIGSRRIDYLLPNSVRWKEIAHSNEQGINSMLFLCNKTLFIKELLKYLAVGHKNNGRSVSHLPLPKLQNVSKRLRRKCRADQDSV